MPENTGEVQAFRFDKDGIEEMREIYKEILHAFGVKNSDITLETIALETADGDKNGVMFNNYISNLFKDDAERKERASKVFEEIKNTRVSPYVKAYIAEMSGDYIPYDTVLTSARMVGGEKGKNGKSLQMGCGEGKTGVLSMAAYSILQQSSKKQVFLTSSTENLAAEALDKIDFYEKVGLADQVVLIDSKGITRPVFEDGVLKRDDVDKKVVFDRKDFSEMSPKDIKKALTTAYKSRLVISDNVTLMQDAMKGYLPEPKANERELLADEADFVLLDSYRPLQRTTELTSKEMKDVIEQRKQAYRILEEVKRKKPEGLFVKDDESQYVDFTKAGRALVVKEIMTSNKASKTDWNVLFDYVYDALVVDTVYKENRDYQILNDGKKIVSEDRAAGVPIDLPEGVKQALEIKLQREGTYKGEISPERRVVDTLNTQSFFKKYFNGTKHFVSGTLGADSKAIVEELKNFGVSKEEGDIYEAPPKEKRRREDRQRRFLKNENNKRKEIVKSTFEEIGKERPVLIGAVSEKEINELKGMLAEEIKESGKVIRILEFTAASEDIFKQDKENLKPKAFREKYGVDVDAYKDYKSLIKNESGKKNTITLGTSILGRGTTIKTSKAVDFNGGIHVIIDGLHETSSRNQEQYKARTARGDNQGSTQEFFSPEDIPEEFRKDLYGIKGADEAYKEVYEKIDARTSGIRNYVVKFVDKTVEKLEEIDDLEIPDAYKEQAKSLLTQRAFSIKNRACGVSDKFRTNIKAYEREIDAYAKLYVAKYQVTDEKYFTGERFDETKWLAENGYKDIARTHIPFRRTSEKEIFRRNGIKDSKMAAEPIIEKSKQQPEIEQIEQASAPQFEVLKHELMHKQITDEEARKPLNERAVEMHVAENLLKNEDYVTSTESTFEFKTTDQDSFVMDAEYEPIGDVVEETFSKADAPKLESFMTTENISNMFYASKDFWALSWNKVKELYGFMKSFTISSKNTKVNMSNEKTEAADEVR